MNRRQLVLDLLDGNTESQYVPAGFFIHFDSDCHKGQAAIDKHMEYFRYTGMDFVKVQYEAGFPPFPGVEKPVDWAKVPMAGKEFFADQLAVVDGLVKAAKDEALVIVTLYSPFMLAGFAGGLNRVLEHIRADPAQFKKGIEIITDSLLVFVRECIKLGVDGFYTSTQGGEARRLGSTAAFTECVKPFDLTVMNEVNDACDFNILHICDYLYGYSDLSHFLDYPGDVVNCNLRVGSEDMTPHDLSEMFGRPFMGGMERKGTIASGNADQIRTEVQSLLAGAGDRYMLGADCTLPADLDWDNVRTAITAAHEHSTV